jgi:DNA-binding MarR family transcriptional regulator
MSKPSDSIAISLLSEIIVLDQLARARLSKVLPKGMELSHFSVLNHLAHVHGERSPAELARVFNVTRGAMTNTLNKLELAGQIHIRPDWDDARRTFVSISGAGKLARDSALAAAAPVLADLVSATGPNELKSTLSVLREMRRSLSDQDS